MVCSGPLSAGGRPAGVTIADVNGDQMPDLLVGNQFGDLLILLGNGNGTFKPFVNADRAVPFVTGDFNGDGVPDVLLANQAADTALIQLRTPGTTNFTVGNFVQTHSDGLKAPGAIQLADLNGDGI